ncbi:M20/M25/M40 family metallo-hydrolase [Corynebacterium flavescens]|uniref:M20/M25/M40 family metallo-hydrolase n=2 Tax=Corynebacterium flavescens TaxID=28028 RepID=UPI00264908F3|nr:M20/M25/M40 family metallo-hydrolase [Corynebacterium flavescens]MDN6100559.1 M20/M25/M40 family metallo-hydrolase [Corynebacterium flavescens]MDN6430984.1 M20/M25/M40 family metallo-hydrolase [Corynebacterium flavescens]MDN6474767.1 M20/M25/M40 family metallo-hydrolase [Corynebacterium flavescens]MDN6531473.1 M20/M25/M40 family metallo-hydrolase [Corynebacterium flavescens]MDN6646007.1 M20/M25/M40 family metallo-hydrolase [Corynebacterium flavescens]
MNLYEETLELLQELIRNACVNDLTPDSGNEVRNADTLERFFADTPVKIQRFESHPTRVSIAFTVPGDSAKEPLTLLGHTDVVPIDAPKWSKPPFEALIEDGKIYGRGAVDMLFITASMAAVTRKIAQEGNPGGELTFVGIADEEARGGLGGKWLVENHPDAFSWKNCLSETGGSHLPGAIAFNVGEKGAGQRRLHVHGDAGHGSTPYGKDFAIVKIGEVARRIAAAEPPAVSNEVWEGFVRTFGFDPATEAALIDGTGDYSAFGSLAAYAHAFSHTTIAETVLRAGNAINVLPSHAYLEMDIRPFPGQTQDDLDDFLRTALGDLADEVEIEHLLTEDATQSSTDTALWHAIEDTAKEFFPDKDVLPVLATGGSDLRFARRLGGNAYGFALHAANRDMASANSQLHSHDEHLYLEDLELTVRGYDSLVHRFLSA